MTDPQTDFDFLPLRVIGKSADGKNRYDRDSKRKLIAACQEPGASVAGLALKAGVNANQLRKWISIDRTKTRRRPGRPPAPARTSLPARELVCPKDTLHVNNGGAPCSAILGRMNPPDLKHVPKAVRGYIRDLEERATKGIAQR
ncbi:transposase, partial [Paraburkholderia sp. EG286B]|uniref:transposase n=1 Tax=Paraburkholderia sp. EG286B TaxID=3237011 RepID=UPI0034D1A3D4